MNSDAWNKQDDFVLRLYSPATPLETGIARAYQDFVSRL